MIDKLKSKDSIAIVLRFWKRWALMDQLEKKRKMMKYTQVIMSRTRLNEQGCFWRWKFQMKYGFMPVAPKHRLVIKKIERMTFRAERKNIRAAFFMILLKSRPIGGGLVVGTQSGRYTVHPDMAKHMQRLAGTYTPQPA